MPGLKVFFIFFKLRVLEKCILQKKHQHIFQCFIMFHEVCLMFCLSFQKTKTTDQVQVMWKFFFSLLKRETPFRLEEFLDEDWGLGVWWSTFARWHRGEVFFWMVSMICLYTLPETISSPLKIGLPNRKVVFPPFISGGENVSFREGIFYGWSLYLGEMIPKSFYWFDGLAFFCDVFYPPFCMRWDLIILVALVNECRVDIWVCLYSCI